MTRSLPLLLVFACQPAALDGARGDTELPAPDSGAGSADGGGADGGGASPSDGGGAGIDNDACDPLLELLDWTLTEGDTLAGTLRCQTQAPLGAFDVQALTLPAGAALDAGTGALSWATGLDDAGTYDIVVAVSQAGAAGLPESASATLSVADDAGHPDNSGVDPLTYTREWGLPVIHVQVAGADYSYRPATIWWEGEEYQAEAKVRGASSYYYPKNSFALRFDSKHEIDLDDQGMGKRDHVLLVTPFDDNSYVRQKLAYDTWAAIADFWGDSRLTPRSFFTVLYLNGEYWGLYTGLDRIDNEFIKQMGLDPEGNLYKAVNHEANFYLTGSSGGAKATLHDGYEKKEGADLSDFGDLDALVAFTGGSSDDDFHAAVDAWLPAEEFMDWFLFVHWTAADDSGGKNAYLYNDPTSTSFRYVPWDFNHSYGQNWYTARTSASTLNDFTWTNAIFKHFQQHPVDSEALWDRYRQMANGGPLDGAWQRAQIDGYYADINDSAQRDWDQWGDAYRSYSSWSGYRNSAGDWTDFDGERAYLEAWLDDRDAVMRAAH